jgi:hypothetical protein
MEPRLVGCLRRQFLLRADRDQHEGRRAHGSQTQRTSIQSHPPSLYRHSAPHSSGMRAIGVRETNTSAHETIRKINAGTLFSAAAHPPLSLE